MYLDTGVIKLDNKKLPVDVLKYLYRVYKKAHVDIIDVFYQEGMSMYIGAESLDTNMLSLYKINLNDNASSGTFQVDEEEEDDFDLSDFDLVDEDIMSTAGNLLGTSEQPVETKPIIKFTTLTNFLNCVTVTDSCVVTIDKNVIVRSSTSQFTLPLVPSTITIEKYLQMMNVDAMANKWEKVNVEAIKTIASAVSVAKRQESDMYVAVEKNRIYSDNKDVVFETGSWNVKGSYTFNYTTIDALKSIPKGYSVYVAKHDGRIMLRVEDIYFGWDELVEVTSDNIMSFLDMSKFINVVSINKKEFGKFAVMDGFTSDEMDGKLEIEVVSDATVSLRRKDNQMLIKGSGKVGSKITLCDSKAFIQLMRASDSDAPVISIDSQLRTNPVALIEGKIKILTSIEDFEVDE